MRIQRAHLILIFSTALIWAQIDISGLPRIAAHLELVTEPVMPARVYLFKDGRPFRVNPVEALLPLRVDLFYRERLWQRRPSPDTLEVTCNDQSHFILLKGRARFDLPAGHYRVEAYRGFFFEPAATEFDLSAGDRKRIALPMKNWAGAERDRWVSGDDHIHLTRALQDNDVYLHWLQAEDLSVGNFLQLQRQTDAAVQYAFGSAGQATIGARFTIRAGQESRSEFYGHINLLGGRALIRPVSGGTMYANSPDTSFYPALVFRKGRIGGATVGYAHFDGSMPHSTLLMDLVNRSIDFIEVFQFGVLKTAQWYELLNAGFQVTGIAGSDFPVPLSRSKDWTRSIPLLGPERTLAKARSGLEPYAAWAAGVRSGDVMLTNGPLVNLQADERTGNIIAAAAFYRPLEHLEIVRNGKIEASVSGDGRTMRLMTSTKISIQESCWIAARVVAEKRRGEPDIQAHTSPVYLLRNGKPVFIAAAREALARKWRAEMDWYRSAPLVFDTVAARRSFFDQAEKVLEALSAR